MRARAGVVCLGLGVLVGATASAAEHSSPVEQSPDIELLEYLGGLVETRDNWVGPDDMQGASDVRAAPIVLDDDAADAEKVR
jgi:hypothetical protein